ncbi:MAG: phosphate ABC transporter permease subunit PstC [Crocinitomicaceae bacterium]|nr:phosphate ABC transporter permease subunit PstC [Crocinitomicaceae bacterium]
MIKNKTFKSIIEKLIEKVFSISGLLTSILIVFICYFLFKEGIGFFKNSTIENGYGLYVNSKNKNLNLSSQDLKQIFDGNISNWKELNGINKSIEIIRIDDVFSIYSEEEIGENYENLSSKTSELIANKEGSIGFFPIEYEPKGSRVTKLPTNHLKLSDFLRGKEWLPTATPAPLFGVLPLIYGTLLVSFLAILIAVPLGLGVAIYLSELASASQRKIMKPIIELLAGIPSVVYGFFGLVVLSPFVQKIFNLPIGETALTGSLILAIMALPTIISVAEDAMRNTPRSMREASLALGATHWQTIYKVIIPYSKSGIITAIVLGMGRAIGETMAVLMVTGNAAIIPHSIFDSVRTIPATIAAELGEAPSGEAHYQALFLLGCVLFTITMIISIVSELISKKSYKKY